MGNYHCELKYIDGYFVALLWEKYQKTGDQKALETFDRRPNAPQVNPFSADLATVDRIKKVHSIGSY